MHRGGLNVRKLCCLLAPILCILLLGIIVACNPRGVEQSISGPTMTPNPATTKAPKPAWEIQAEQRAGLNLVDVYGQGATTLITNMRSADLLGQIEPLLILPEVSDPKAWRAGQILFADKAHQVIQMSAMKAMYTLRVKKVILVAPWGDYVNRLVTRFPEDSGIVVANSKMVNAELKDFPEIPLSRSYAMCLKGHKDAPHADCIYVPCSSWPFSENIEPLEKEAGLPVIASTQSMLWGSLRLIGIKTAVPGYGRLFRDY